MASSPTLLKKKPKKRVYKYKAEECKINQHQKQENSQRRFLGKESLYYSRWVKIFNMMCKRMKT